MPELLVPCVTLVAGQPVVSSLDVAAHFGKQHKHVLRDIQRIIEETPLNFTEPNFGLSEYIDITGRKLPAYNLTRDGFTLLAMGFTGKKALQWKIAYIEAFNAMEARLAGTRAQASGSYESGLHELKALYAEAGAQAARLRELAELQETVFTQLGENLAAIQQLEHVPAAAAEKRLEPLRREAVNAARSWMYDMAPVLLQRLQEAQPKRAPREDAQDVKREKVVRAIRNVSRKDRPGATARDIFRRVKNIRSPERELLLRQLCQSGIVITQPWQGKRGITTVIYCLAAPCGEN